MPMVGGHLMHLKVTLKEMLEINTCQNTIHEPITKALLPYVHWNK
jgi:hypothetical protein